MATQLHNAAHRARVTVDITRFRGPGSPPSYFLRVQRSKNQRGGEPGDEATHLTLTCKSSASGAYVKWRLCMAWIASDIAGLSTSEMLIVPFGDNLDLYRKDSEKSDRTWANSAYR